MLLISVQVEVENDSCYVPKPKRWKGYGKMKTAIWNAICRTGNWIEDKVNSIKTLRKHKRIVKHRIKLASQFRKTQRCGFLVYTALAMAANTAIHAEATTFDTDSAQ